MGSIRGELLYTFMNPYAECGVGIRKNEATSFGRRFPGKTPRSYPGFLVYEGAGFPGPCTLFGFVVYMVKST
jgi:hypothetical protein